VPLVGSTYRPVALGRDGMVASAHPYATLAGLDVLRAGGTAADAAVAANAVLAVTQPAMCGVGGDLFVLYYEAATRRIHFLNGAGRSGSRASLDELARRGRSALPIVGPMTVSVPGCVRGWGMLLERFGTRPLASLLEPAIHYAEGFPITSLMSQYIDEFARVTDDPEWHRVFRAAGRAPALGEPLAQPDLARTLRDLGRDGPDLFYAGRVGRAIAERLAAEGFLTADDLVAHSGEWGEPIATTYRDVRVWETPPPTQGLAALIALNILERVPLARRALHSVQHLHLLLEVVKLAYADRDRFIGDPAHAHVPLVELLDKRYAARRYRAFDARKAQAYTAGDPDGGDTTGLVVVDRQGNVASVIQSLFNAFGAGIVVPGCGVVLQNRGRHFELDPAHPSALAPRKRPFHTLMASIVTRDDRPVHALATMGGSGQAQFHIQILTNLIDYALDPQEAVERPRFLLGAFYPEDAADTVHLESRVPRAVAAALVGKGHAVRPAPALFVRTGHAHAVSFRDGTLLGGADPRGDGVALGF